MYKSMYKSIGSNTTIADDVVIECKDKFVVGDNSYIGPGTKITCRSFEAGDYLYMPSGVEIGRGGCNGVNSTVKIGNGVGIFENTIINPSDSIEIGDNCGIGAEVMIWTHGAWLDITQGFPSDFGPVKIGKNVWLPARSIVLPNVTIGNDVVIGINSIINRSLPSGCFAAGSPCKVIKENVYPKKLSRSELSDITHGIIDDWLELIKYKLGKIDFSIVYEMNNHEIILNIDGKITIYNIVDKTMEGGNGYIEEDLRDYLRRRGIKIYNGEGFKSI